MHSDHSPTQRRSEHLTSLIPPNIVNTVTSLKDVIIEWSPPPEEGDTITKYQVLIYVPSTQTFIEDLINCGGSDQTTFDNTSCAIPFTHLMQIYGFQVGVFVQAKVRAYNINEWGGYSQLNVQGAVVQSVPVKLTTLAQGPATTIDRVQLNWQALTSMIMTGGTYSISSYNLEMFKTDKNNWEELVGQTKPFTQLTYTKFGLTTGENYSFRIRASKTQGFGPYSDVIVIRADDSPAKPDPLTTAINLANVKIQWLVPITNGAPITAYQVLILQADGIAYSKNTQYCDVSQSATVSSRECSIPIAVLRTAPYALVQGVVVKKAIVKAYNENGWSAYSQSNTVGALVEFVAHKMNAPVSGLDTNQNQIHVNWTALTSVQTGGAAITSYNLQFDSGSNGASWTDVVGFTPAFTGLTTILSSTISPGVTYKFRIRASNIHGFGTFSDVTSIKAAQIPSKVSVPVTQIDAATGLIKIQWTAAHDGSQSITHYIVKIADSTGTTWTPDSANCPGTNPAVLSCLISMNTLTLAPYNYALNSLVQVRVTASNSYGPGPVSSQNTSGALIRRVPDNMGAITVVSKTESEIVVSWTALTGVQTGNSAILGYALYFDNATGTTNLLLTETSSLTFIVSGLTGGQIYTFKVIARNVYGLGQASDELVVLASDRPDKTSILSVTLQGTLVQIQWEEPNEHSNAITNYEVLFRKADGSFTQDLTNCDGTTPAILSSRTCSIPMLQIQPLTNLLVDQLIQVKVRANNANGWSVYSELNMVGQVVNTLPATLLSPTFSFATVTNTSILINWIALTGTAKGGAAVLIDTYEIQWDQATLNWVSLNSNIDASLVSFTHQPLTPNVTYRYRIRAINKYGSALAFSPEMVVKTAQPPDTPDPPTTEVHDIYVQISWSEPFSNHAAITGYTVFVEHSDGQFVIESTYCKGTDPLVIPAQICFIPMTALWTIKPLSYHKQKFTFIQVPQFDQK